MGRVPGTRLDLLDQPSPGTLPEAPLHGAATIWNWEPSSRAIAPSPPREPHRSAHSSDRIPENRSTHDLPQSGNPMIAAERSITRRAVSVRPLRTLATGLTLIAATLVFTVGCTNGQNDASNYDGTEEAFLDGCVSIAASDNDAIACGRSRRRIRDPHQLPLRRTAAASSTRSGRPSRSPTSRRSTRRSVTRVEHCLDGFRRRLRDPVTHRPPRTQNEPESVCWSAVWLWPQSASPTGCGAKDPSSLHIVNLRVEEPAPGASPDLLLRRRQRSEHERCRSSRSPARMRRA